MNNTIVAVFSSFTLAVILSLIGFVVFNFRKLGVSSLKYFCLLLASLALWTLFFIVECISKSPEVRLFAIKFENLGIALSAVGFLLYCFYSFGQERKINPFIKAGIAAVVLSYLFFAWFNPGNLYFESYEMVYYNESLYDLVINHGKFFNVFQVLIYGSFIFGALYSIFMCIKKKLIIQQALICSSAVVFPLIFALLYKFDAYVIDLTHVGFCMTAVLLFFGFARYGVFDTIFYVKQNIFDFSEDLLIVAKTDLEIAYMNTTTKKFLDEHQINYKDKAIGDILPEFSEKLRNNQTTIIKIDAKNGEKIYLHARAIELSKKSGEKIGFLFTIYDITETQKAKNKINYMLEYDGETGLINASKFISVLSDYKNQSKKGLIGNLVCACKIINADILSYTISAQQRKQLNKLLAEYLQEQLSVYPEMILGRFSEDEFFVFSNGAEIDEENFLSLLHKNRNISITVDGQPLNLKLSMGLYKIAEQIEISEIISNVSFTLKAAVADPRRKILSYDKKMQLQHDLHKRIFGTSEKINFSDDLELKFQPVINVKTNSIAGVEVLTRWNHPRLGQITPDVFLPVFEKTDRFIDFGKVVFKKSIRALKQFLPTLTDGFYLSVNISKRQINDPGFFEQLKTIIKEENINPKMLDFEIAETSVIEDFENVAELAKQIKSLGATITLDDLGSDNTDVVLSYVTKINFDKIKLDLPFIENAELDGNKIATIKSLGEMCRKMNIDIVVKHVETLSALEYLKAQDFEYVQGYVFSRGTPEESFIKYYETFKSKL